MSWAAVAGSVIATVGGYVASKKLSKKSKTEKAAQDALTRNLQEQATLGKQLTSQGTAALSPAIRRFTRLSGSAPEALNELSPELNARAAQDRSALTASNELAPRGGVSSDFMSRLPFMRIGETSNMLTGARSNAAGQLANIGTNLIGQGVSAYGGSTGAAGTQLDYGLKNNAFQYGAGQDMGNAFAQLMKMVGDRYSAKKTTTGDPTANPYYAGSYT